MQELIVAWWFQLSGQNISNCQLSFSSTHTTEYMHIVFSNLREVGMDLNQKTLVSKENCTGL